MRGLGEAYDQRRQQQVDDSNDYYVSSANFPVEELSYPTVPASAYIHLQYHHHHHHQRQQQQQQQQHLHVMATTNRHMQYESAYAAPHLERMMNYPEVNLQQQHFGGLSPRQFNDTLIPPNLMQHTPMNLYDIHTSSAAAAAAAASGHVSAMASPSNMAAGVASPTVAAADPTKQKVRYNELQQIHRPRMSHNGKERKEDRNPDDDVEAERYKEIYHQVFARHSRTPSEARTQTEHTRTDYTQTERTRGVSQAQTNTSRSNSESTSSGSSTSVSSFSEGPDEDWEENIRSTLNEMAGNLKNLGGIHCNQAGPDSTEVQLKLNLPVPMQYMDHLDSVAKQGLTQLDLAAKHGFNTAVATLSPKKCNMQYGYSHLDEQVFDMEQQVFDMEQRFVGTINELQGNMMPVYKSLFESQSDDSSEVDEDQVAGDDDDDDDEDDEEESTYEDPRFLPQIPKEPPGVASSKKARSKRSSRRDTPPERNDMPTISRVPSHIIVTDAPSDFSSADSWRLSSTLATPAIESPSKKDPATVESIWNNVAVAADADFRKVEPEDRDSPDWVPAVREKLDMIGKESPVVPEDNGAEIPAKSPEKPRVSDHKEKRKEAKTKPKRATMLAEIPQSIVLVVQTDSQDEIVESFSEITTELVEPTSQDLSESPYEGPSAEVVVSPEKKDLHIDDGSLNDMNDGNDEKSCPMDEKNPVPVDKRSASLCEEDELMRGPFLPRLEFMALSPAPMDREEPHPSTQKDPCGTSESFTAKSTEKNETIPPPVERSEVDELMPPQVNELTRPIIAPLECTIPPFFPSSKVVSPRVSESNDAEPEMQKTPLTVSPVHLRVMRLRKQKADSQQKNKAVEIQSTEKSAAEVAVAHVETKNVNEDLIDEEILVKEFLKPKSQDATDTSLMNEGGKRDFSPSSDNKKLEDAIDKVLGPGERDASDFKGVVPDDDVAVFQDTQNHATTPDSMDSSHESITDDMAPKNNVKVSLEVDESMPNVVDEAGEEEVPDDERVKVLENTSPQAPEASLDNDTTTATNEVPEDERLATIGNNVVATTSPATVDELKVESNPDQEGSKSELISVALAPSHDEPFDIFMNTVKTPNDNSALEMSMCESDRSFRSARQGTVSGDSQNENPKNVFFKKYISAIREEVGAFEHLIPATTGPSCEDLTLQPGQPRPSEPDEDGSAFLSEDKVLDHIQSSAPQESEHNEVDFHETDPLFVNQPSGSLEDENDESAQLVSVHRLDEVERKNDDSRTDASHDFVSEEDRGDLPLCTKVRETALEEAMNVEDKKGDEIMTCRGESFADECIKSTVSERINDHPGKVDVEEDSSIDNQNEEENQKDANPVEQKKWTESEVVVNERPEYTGCLRSHRSRELLYQVQGFAEFCQKIEKSLPAPSKELSMRSSVVASVGNEKLQESSSSSVQHHQRSLGIEFEDPEESSIDDQTTRKKQTETFEAEASSIDQNTDFSETDSEYSTTNTEGHPHASVLFQGPDIEEKSSIDEGHETSPSFSDGTASQCSFVEEQSDINTNTSSSHWSEEDDILPDMKSMRDQTEHDRHMSATRRFRNQIDIDADEVEIRYLSEHTRNHLFSSDATVKTTDTQSKSILSMEETLQSKFTRIPTLKSNPSKMDGHGMTSKSIRAAYSTDTHLTSPLTSSFTIDTPLAAASTISSIRTFDHESVVSGQQGILRRRYPHDDEGSIQSSSSYLKIEPSSTSVAIPISAVYSHSLKQDRKTVELVGLLTLCYNATLSFFIFFFEWGKFLVMAIRRKRRTKLECAPTGLGLRQPDQVLRREEIQDRSMDSFIHKTNGRKPYYLHHQIDQREHVATTMTVTPPMPSMAMYDDDIDEIGTCVGSIVTDTQPPTWEVISSPRNQTPKSFGAVRKVYSSLSSVSSRTGWRHEQENEDINWI